MVFENAGAHNELMKAHYRHILKQKIGRTYHCKGNAKAQDDHINYQHHSVQDFRSHTCLLYNEKISTRI